MGAKRQAKKQLELQRELDKQRAAATLKAQAVQAKRATKDAKRSANQEAWNALSPTQQRNRLIGLGVAALLVVVFIAISSSKGSDSSSDSPKPPSKIEACIQKMQDMSNETGQSERDLSQTLNGSRNFQEACRKNTGG